MAEPPKDEPPPDDPGLVEADAGFEPSPSGASLCGFKFPLFNFSLKLNLPSFPPFPFPPVFNFYIGLNCDLSNPIEADFAFGGGRVSNSDPEADPEF